VAVVDHGEVVVGEGAESQGHGEVRGKRGVGSTLAQEASALSLAFTPTSASWLNMVEGFFAEITRKQKRRGVFKSVPELKAHAPPSR